MPEYLIDVIWDDEAYVWVASSDDVPGLALESGSFDALIERVRFIAPQLLSLNCGIKADTEVAYRVTTERLVKDYI